MTTTPESINTTSSGSEEERGVWSSESQGPLMHWLLFELYSKYEPGELHRKLDGVVFRVLTLPSGSVSVNDREAIVLLRQEHETGQYTLCVGRGEPWQSVWPEDRIMTAIQSAGLATARHLGSTVVRKAVMSSRLPVGELLAEGKLWRKAQVEGKI